MTEPAGGNSSGDKGVGRALVVHPFLRQTEGEGGPSDRLPQARLDEAVGLAAAISLDVVQAILVGLARIKPSTYIGTGKVEELAGLVEDAEVDVVVMNCALSPVQQRNLERNLKTKVIDRTGLILEIFGERAATREGRLQVELAHLNYQKSRLVRSWTHLERQRGGVGFLGGPGETQIEADRRILSEKIVRLKRELDDVVRTRGIHRQSRKKVPFPVVALVGYTNAGKSSLFNRLTQARVMAADLLFATLDPTMRGLQLPSGRKIILSDTVGFVSDLPTHLVAAFRATLEEVLEADLILHVRDIAHPETQAQRADVHHVLAELGIKAEEAGDRIVEVLNKIDLLPPEGRIQLLNREARLGHEAGLPVSALTGEGTQALLQLIDARLGQGEDVVDVEVELDDGATLAWLYAHGHVVDRRDADGIARLKVGLAAAEKGRLEKRLAKR